MILDSYHFKKTKSEASTSLCCPSSSTAGPHFSGRSDFATVYQIQKTYTTAPYLGLVLTATVVASC